MNFNFLPTWCWLLLFSFSLVGCAHTPLKPAGALSSYVGMKQNGGMFTQTAIKTNKNILKRARTASIIPIHFTPSAMEKGLSAEQVALVSNAATRGLCNELSRSFKIVPLGQPADLTVNGAITDVKMTNPVVSAVSQLGNIASSIAAPIPIPLKRLPLGMGGLALEAEVKTPDGAQVAAIIWSQDANPFSSKPRVSEVGDAYDIATGFGGEFSRVLKGREFSMNPATVLASLPQRIADKIPTAADLHYAIDGTAKASACEMYGKGPGVFGSIAAGFGAPPAWTDNGARAPAQTFEPQQPVEDDTLLTSSNWSKDVWNN